ALAEERLELVQIGGGRRLKHPEAEGLCTRRRGPIEHRVGAGDCDPAGAALGKQARPGLDEAGIAESFGALEAPRERQVGEEDGSRVAHQPSRGRITMIWSRSPGIGRIVPFTPRDGFENARGSARLWSSVSFTMRFICAADRCGASSPQCNSIVAPRAAMRPDDREYLREEQRGQAGCSAARMPMEFHHGLLSKPTRALS